MGEFNRPFLVTEITDKIVRAQKLNLVDIRRTRLLYPEHTSKSTCGTCMENDHVYLKI